MQYKWENKRNSNAIDDDQVSKNAKLEKKHRNIFWDGSRIFNHLRQEKIKLAEFGKDVRILANIEKDLTKMTTAL